MQQKGLPQGWDYAVLILLPTLINAPNFPVARAVGSIQLLVAMSILGFLILRWVLPSTFSPKRSREIGKEVGAFFSTYSPALMAGMLLAVLLSVSLIRSFFAGYGSPFSFIAFSVQCFDGLLYGFVLFRLARSPERRLPLIASLALGVCLFVCANLAGLAFGMQGGLEVGEVGVNKTLSMVGITASRIAFPFAPGLNGFAITSVFGLLLCLTTAMACKGLARAGMFLAAVPCVVATVLIDSRAAVAFALLALLLAPLYRSVRTGGAVLFVTLLGMTVIPYFARDAVAVIESTGVLSVFQREGTQAAMLGIASGREFVWDAIAAHVLTPQGLLGFGNMGHAASGASVEYAWIFAEQGASAHSAHNAPLQYAIDMGVLGVVVWWVFWSTLMQGLRADPAQGRLLLAPLLFVLLMGTSEASGTVYAFDSFQLLLLCVGMVGATYVKEPAKRLWNVGGPSAARRMRAIAQSESHPLEDGVVGHRGVKAHRAG